MTDVQKLKETTCKEIHSLLMSGNQAVTKRQIESDYKAFIGAHIPFREMGYMNLESFLRDNSQYFKLYWEGPNLMIKHVSNSETEHIEGLISRQKPKKRRPVRSNPRYMGGSRYPKPRYQPVLRPAGPIVPNILRGEIRGLLMEYGNGILGSNFDAAYAKRFGSYVNFKAMKFASLLEMLKAMPDIVSIEQEPSGIYKIYPRSHKNTSSYKNRGIHSGIVERPKLSKDYSSSRGHYMDQSNRDQNDIPPRFRKQMEENKKWPKSSDHVSQSSSRSENRDGDSFEGNVYDNSGVNAGIQREIQTLLSKHREGVWASRFQAAYRVEYKKELDIRSQGYNSIINLMADLPHIVTIERANQRDWLLFDTRYRKQSTRDIHSGVTNALANRTDPSKKPGPCEWSNTAAPPTIDEDLKETVRQVVAYHPQGVLYGELPMVYEHLTGEELVPSRFGYPDLEQLLLALDDVIHLDYDKGTGRMLLYPQVKETVPRRDKLKNMREKAPCPLKEHPAALPSRTRREVPTDVVGPDSSYRLQQVNRARLADNGNYIEVYVATVINPGNFWLQLKGVDTTDGLEELMDRLEDVYSNTAWAEEYALPAELVTRDQICAAVYPPEGDYHRCRITGFREADFAELFYVDYGSTYVVTKKSLKFLKWRDFELPAQAVPAKLSNIKPVGGVWTREARDLMLQLVNNRPLIALVTDIALDGTVSVCLTDTSGDTDIHVNDVLVSKGLAEMDFNPTEAYLPPPVPSSAPPAGPPHPNDGRPRDNLGRSFSGSGNTEEESESERRLKYVQLSSEYSIHIILYKNQAYVTSGEISNLLWPGKDILRSMMRQRRMNVTKVVLPKDENPDIFDELARYEVGGTSDSNGELKTHVTIFELPSVLTILNTFDHPSKELTSAIRHQASSFSPLDAYWKGGESEDSDEEDSEDEECFTLGRQTLESTLQLLQFKRKRILQAMQKMDSDNTINLVEDLQVVEKQLQDFKHRLKELDRLEKSEEAGKPVSKKLTKEEEFVCDIVSEQSDSYLKANAGEIAQVSSHDASPMISVLNTTPRVGVKTNPVAPMVAESKVETPACSDSQSTTTPVQLLPLGHSLVDPAVYSMGLGSLPDTSMLISSNALMPLMPSPDLSDLQTQQKMMAANQYFMHYQSLLLASMQAGVNPMFGMPGLGTPLAGLGTQTSGLGSSIGMNSTVNPGPSMVSGITPTMPLQGRGRGLSYLRPPPGGLQKKE